MADYRHHRPGRSRHNDRPGAGSGSDLLGLLRGLDGASYGAYKRAAGQWDWGDFSVHIDRVQADPYAPPSAVRILAPAPDLPVWARTTRDQQVAAADFLVRRFRRLIDGQGDEAARAVSIASAGAEILERSAASVTESGVELRIQVRLPARGRTVLGRQAAHIFEVQLPRAVRAALDFSQEEDLRRHVESLEDHRALQRILDQRGWVAFVADGSVLARQSGVSALPLAGAVPFASPDSLRRRIELPHAGTVDGMALEPGITVIVGGGYHGKSTLLGALQQGVYPHVPGDGRELVAALASAMKLRAADGRPITRVDVSPFITHLPTGGDTCCFSTQNASGSTSQAASLMEAVEAGAPLLLIDEDTSATNLMIRDARMRELVPAEQEPITPLVDRIRALAGCGVSTVMVMGGSGAYLDVADRVLQMDAYRCHDVSLRAAEVTRLLPRPRADLPDFPWPRPRAPRRLRGGGERSKTKSRGLSAIDLDREAVDLSDVEQIVDPGQTEAIAWALRGITESLADGVRSLAELGDQVESLFEDRGLDATSSFGARRNPAFLVRPRRVDVIAAVNRYRRLLIGDER